MATAYQVQREELARFKRNHEYFQKMISTQVVGYGDAAMSLMIALLAKGHILLEGVPGTAKTTLARTFASLLGMTFKRVQFTQDLMPMDITGHYVYDQVTKQFELRKGPVFTNILLADEVNRAPPKTQSAMLETMEERQVSIEGRTIPLDDPFMVVATMNPIDSEGVYRLPEAQLDRFMMRVNMHYVKDEEEVQMLKIKLSGATLGGDEKRLRLDAVRQGMKIAKAIHVGDATLQYLQKVAARTRFHPDVRVGASPRSMTQMLSASQARALLLGRPYVLPEDVEYVTPRVLGHRILLKVDAEARGRTPAQAIQESMAQVPPPKVVMKK